MPRIRLTALAAVWLFGIIWGGRYMLHYDTTPGVAANPEFQWPHSTALQRSPDRFTVVMIAQPACSCTHASITELERTISAHPDRAQVTIVFERNGKFVDPEKSQLWAEAERMAGATVLVDETGGIAREFHAETSGQVFVYDCNGMLRFSGGITSSRGHSGESDGSRAIGLLLSGRSPTGTQCPVFGCSLQ